MVASVDSGRGDRCQKETEERVRGMEEEGEEEEERAEDVERLRDSRHGRPVEGRRVAAAD